MQTPPSKPERQFVDIDPWVVLLEGLMEIPEEEPAKRTRTKRKVGQGHSLLGEVDAERAAPTLVRVGAGTAQARIDVLEEQLR